MHFIKDALLIATLASSLVGFNAHAGNDSFSSQMTIKIPENIRWGKGPAGLPSGLMATVLEGDPAQAGPFTIRLKVPAEYQIPAHYHPAIEHVTVLSGTFYMGHGDTLDKAKGEKLTAGSFVAMPPKMNHFAYTKDEGAVIQLHGIGPWEIVYLNPKDDPRSKKSS